MAARYREVLDSFTGDKIGEGRAWTKATELAATLVDHKAVGRLAIGVRSGLNEIGQPVWDVVLVDRTS